MQFQYSNASIECEKAIIISRDIKTSGYVNIKHLGKCFKYNLKRNSEAKINKELTPKLPVYCPTSHLDLGVEIAGEDIMLLVASPKKLKFSVQNYTGTHKVQAGETECYSYAEITKMFPNMLQLKDPKQMPPAPIQLYLPKPNEQETNP
jgi:hypothetical protein